MKIFAIVTAIFLLSTGCSSIHTVHHTVGVQPPLCKEPTPATQAVVFWDTAWRQNQKEPELREGMIASAIGEFFSGSGCYRAETSLRKINDRSVLLATDSEILSAASESGANKAIIIRVEETGPNLILYLSPILWQTRNEVKMNIRILDVNTQTVEADITTDYHRGGPFTLNGTGSLPDDIRSALTEIFTGSAK